MKFNPKVIIIVAASLIILNLVFLDFLFWQLKKEVVVSPFVPETEVKQERIFYQEGCGDECKQEINEEVSRATATLSGHKAAEEEEDSGEVTESPSQPRLVYMPLGSGGSTVSTGWTDIPGSEFIFDLADYPAGTEVYWHVNLKVKDFNTQCYARIYDSDNLRTVDFSELSAAQTSYETKTSNKLVFWAGKNDYKLQIKSLNGLSCYLESPKLVIKG